MTCRAAHRAPPCQMKNRHQATSPSRQTTKPTMASIFSMLTVASALLLLTLALPLASAINHSHHNHLSHRQPKSSSSADEVKLANDKPAAPVDGLDSTSGARLDQANAKREIENLLVRQLSDLIMNNEPAAIRRRLASERIEGQLTAETNRLVRQAVPPFKLGPSGHSLEADADLEDVDVDEEEPGASGGGSEKKRRRHTTANDDDDDRPAAPEDSLQAAQAGNQSGNDPAGTQAVEQFLQEQENQVLQQFDEQQQQLTTVTCSPDYEDQTILVDHDSAQLNELLASGGGLSGGSTVSNLTAEQRQQLLSGADMSGLLANQSGGAGAGAGPPSHFHQQVSIGQCVPAGSRMIEVITKVITPILFTIIIIVGLLGNIIVMLVILEDRQVERELTPTNLLILDLSLADLSFIVLCIPFTGWDYAVGHWVFGSLWCKFNQYLIVVCALSSIYTLVLMSCDRFMAIVYPIECISYRTSRNMLHAIVIKWIVILAVASPTIFMHGLVDSPLAPDQYNCRFLSDTFNPLHFQFIFFITSYFLPLVLIFFLYLSLLRRLWCGQKPIGHKESLKMLESKKKVTWLVASIVLVFAACWFPIQIMLILMRLKTHKITATYVAVQVFAHTLGYMNSCVNPIVYAFASDTFNQSFKKSRLGRACLTYLCCQPASRTGGHHNHNHHHATAHHSLSTTNGHHHLNNQQPNHHHMLASTTTLVAGGGPRQGATSRNSLQITTSEPAPAGRGNKSMSNIFAQPQAPRERADAVARLEDGANHQGHANRQPASLVLEPRDRAPVVAQPQRPPPGAASSSASQVDPVVVAKQLVARMVPQSQGGSSVAHDCQPSASHPVDEGRQLQ